MNRADILDLNKNIQDNIFAYKVNVLPAQVTGFFEAIIADGLLSMMAPVEFQRFNQFLEGCLQSLLHKDYLYLADILQYEILPLLTRSTQ